MMLWQMFTTFFKIGLFSIGGGYAMLSMIQQEIVVKHQWLSQQQMTDMIAVSQMTPGPIAINVATLIGFRQAGFWGSVVTTFGVVLPSLIIMLLITVFYLKLKGKGWFDAVLKGLRPLVIGLIVSAAWMTAKSSFVSLFASTVFASCFALSLKYRTNPIILMVLAGLAGIFFG
jgi:chromate transporter